MRPIPGRMFFLYMFSKGARKYQEISGRNRKKQEISEQQKSPAIK